MDTRRPLEIYVAVGLAAAVLVGCVATWFVMDRRMARERESMRREMQEALKEGLKGAADDMLTKEYVGKKVAEEAGKLLQDPPVEAVSKTAEEAAEAGVKVGSRTATGVLESVKGNEKEIRDAAKAAGDAARVGVDALLDLAKALLGDRKTRTPAKDAEARTREERKDDAKELPDPPKERK